MSKPIRKKKTKTIIKAEEVFEINEDKTIDIDYAHLVPSTKQLMLQYHKNGAYEAGDRNFKCIIGAHVTAYARIILHKSIAEIHKTGGIIIYMDTDSIMFIIRKGTPNPLSNIHEARIGAWSSELNETMGE